MHCADATNKNSNFDFKSFQRNEIIRSDENFIECEIL